MLVVRAGSRPEAVGQERLVSGAYLGALEIIGTPTRRGDWRRRPRGVHGL